MTILLIQHKRSNAEEQLHACCGIDGEAAGLGSPFFHFTGMPKAYKPWGVGQSPAVLVC
jgi:hypothetical protein